jgi:HEAT repeat protein
MSTTLNSETWSSFLKNVVSSNSRASEQQLLKAETKLKIKLPPSYRAFLSFSNGWRLPSGDLALRAVEDIRWFRKEHKDWYEAYQMSAEPLCVLEKDYFDYTKQDCAVFEIKHLAQTLCISEIADDAVLLLNPMVVWSDGEWETWFFSNSAPGAIRYRSFADWINHELDQSSKSLQNSGDLPTVYLDAPGKENRRIRPRQKVPVLEEVLKQLKSNKENDRVNAVVKLGFLGGNQAIESLVEAMKTDPIWRVRWNAADVLGSLRPPEALEALIVAADGSSDGVNVNAIGALANYNDERSGQLLLKILEGCDYNASTAAGALAKRGDVRAIKHLKNFLTDTASGNARVQHIGDIAGRLICQFGEAGYAVLEPLMSNPDIKVRWRAEQGVSDLAYCSTTKSLRGKAYKLLQKCFETETDAKLKKAIEVSIQICAKKNK